MVNAKGGYYGNALQVIVANTCSECEFIAKVLLKNGADVNTKGGYYETAKLQHILVMISCLSFSLTMEPLSMFMEDTMELLSRQQHAMVIHMVLSSFWNMEQRSMLKGDSLGMLFKVQHIMDARLLLRFFSEMELISMLKEENMEMLREDGHQVVPDWRRHRQTTDEDHLDNALVTIPHGQLWCYLYRTFGFDSSPTR